MSRSAVLRRVAVLFCLTVILVIAFWVRSFSFWLPHWGEEQSQYIALAIKMNHTRGLSAYNLQGIDVEIAQLATLKDFNFIIPFYTSEPEGSFIKSYGKNFANIYSVPLWKEPPLFPLILKWSHNAILGARRPFVVPLSNLEESVFRVKPDIIFKLQLWLAIIPIFFSLLTLVIVYFFARQFMKIHASLMAVCILAFSPVGIVCSSRVWTQELQTYLLWAAIFLYWKSLGTKKVVLPFVGGMVLGFSILSNTTSVVFLCGILIYGMITHKKFLIQKWWIFPRTMFNRRFVSFFLGTFFISRGWFQAVWRQYGNIFEYYPPQWGVSIGEESGLRFQPAEVVLCLIGIACLSPAMVLGYASIVRAAQDLIMIARGRIVRTPLVFFWMISLSMLLWMPVWSGNPAEYRHLFPIFPALSILSAFVLEKIQLKFRHPEKNIYRVVAVQWILLIVLSAGSTVFAWKNVMIGKQLF